MQSQQISYRDTGFVSKMVCDLFEGKESLDAFYGNPPTLDNFKAQLVEKKENFTPNQREVLVSSLISQYSNLLQKGSPVDLNIERLDFIQYIYNYYRTSAQLNDWALVFFI